MSEFKFSCPSCQQNIQATSEYSGMLINCPKCGGKLIVPSAPDAPAAQSGSKLSMAASTPHAPESAAAAATFYAAPVRKKKPKTGLIVGLSLGAIAAAGAVYFWPQITKLVASHGTSLTAAADDQAPTNAPPPPPPPLTTEEILQKVGETYRGMADYTAKGKTDCSIDMSGIAPGKGTINMSSTSIWSWDAPTISGSNGKREQAAKQSTARPGAPAKALSSVTACIHQPKSNPVRTRWKRWAPIFFC